MLKISPDSFKVYVKGLILQLFISNSLRGKHFSLILYFTRHQQCRWYLKSPKMSIWIFLCISQVEFFCFFSPLSLWNQDMHWWAPPRHLLYFWLKRDLLGQVDSIKQGKKRKHMDSLSSGLSRRSWHCDSLSNLCFFMSRLQNLKDYLKQHKNLYLH